MKSEDFDKIIDRIFAVSAIVILLLVILLFVAVIFGIIWLTSLVVM